MADIKDLRDRGQYRNKIAESLPETSMHGDTPSVKIAGLRYGENPSVHEGEGGAALYKQTAGFGPSIATAERLQDKKELGFNNIRDADAGLRLAHRLNYLFPGDAIAVIIKHKGPSGVGRHGNLSCAHALAYNCDTVSAFGGVNVYNKTIDADTARRITGYFNELIVAPGYTPEALEIFKQKPDLRVLRTESLDEPILDSGIDSSTILRGGVSQKRQVSHITTHANLEKVSTGRDPTVKELNAALFTWAVAFHTVSNAIIIGDPYGTVGIGRGQGNRADSARLAVWYAENRAKTGASGYVAASDAFFPEPDAPQILADAGVSAIVYPLGSVKDAQTLELADKYGMVMLCTRPIPGTKAVERAFSH